ERWAQLRGTPTLPSRCRKAGAALLLTLTLFAIDQPIPYSHKTHVALGMKCNGCHTMPGNGEAATFPSESLCMGCHASVKKDSPHIQKLAEFAKEKKQVPWVRGYRLPDYVRFLQQV